MQPWPAGVADRWHSHVVVNDPACTPSVRLVRTEHDLPVLGRCTAQACCSRATCAYLTGCETLVADSYAPFVPAPHPPDQHTQEPLVQQVLAGSSNESYGIVGDESSCLLRLIRYLYEWCVQPTSRQELSRAGT